MINIISPWCLEEKDPQENFPQQTNYRNCDRGKENVHFEGGIPLSSSIGPQFHKEMGAKEKMVKFCINYA